MKKTMLTLMAALLLCLTSGAWAQRAAYYQFEAANGAEGAVYTPLADATVLPGLADLSTDLCDDYAWISATEFKAFGDIADDAVMTGIPIGFDFPYADQTFTHFVPTTEGYIALVNAGFKKADIVPTEEKKYAPFAVGLRASGPVYKSAATKVSYKAEAGMLSVEFIGFHYDTVKTGETYTVNEDLSVNYTLRLYPDGKVAFYFGEMKGESKIGRDAKIEFAIGLNEAGGDANLVHYRAPDGNFSLYDWTATKQSEFAIGCKMKEGDKFIPVGTVWTFTAVPCEAPVTSVTGTIDIIRPEGFRVVHAVEANVADGYVTFVSEGPLAEGVEPKTGIVYTQNEALGTTAACVGTGALSKMEMSVSRSDRQKDYYVYTYLYNERCKGGRTYGSRPTPAILRSAPQLAMTYKNDKISLFPKGNDTLAVLATMVNGEKNMTVNTGNVGRFGIPTAGHKVGDTVWTADKRFGGIVIYKGLEPTAAFDYAEPLQSFRNYHFAAFRRDAAGGYVSWFAQADTLTRPAIPFFDDFSTSIPGDPQGYTGNGTFRIYQKMKGFIALNATGEAARLRLETPEMVFPAEADARLILEYNFVVPQTQYDYTLTDKDYSDGNGLYVSVSENGGAWQQVYAIDKSNPDYFANKASIKTKFITLGKYSGKPCRVRIEVVGENLTGDETYRAEVTINAISIVEKPACDAPLAVSVLPETVYGDSARMAWRPFDADQKEAAVAYRLADEAAWHTLLTQTSRDTLGLGGLPHWENVVLGVKTLCAGGKESVYTESAAFKTGYQVPFVEDFAVPGFYEENSGMSITKSYAVPQGWTASTNPLPATGALRLSTTGKELKVFAPLYDWETHKAFDPEAAAGNNCVRLGGVNSNLNENWLVLPPVVLTANHNAVLSFDAALLKGDFTAAATADIDAGAKIIVYAAPMTAADKLASQTFTAENAVLTLTPAELAEIGALKKLTAVLPTGLTGKVRIGIYYNFGAKKVPATWNQLYLDNIAVVAPCGAVADLKTMTVDETAAEIRWRAYPGVAEYNVMVAEAEGSATPETIAVAEPKAVLTGLEKATAYKVSVSYACADGNAPVSEISFTTAGMPCGEPTALTATALTQTSAVLSWTGAAETYKLEFKETAAAEYVQRTVSGTTYTLTNLKAGTGYVFRVQAVCNAAAGDESGWSETAAFKTADLTCFAPTGLKVTPSISRAEATWEGEAGQYQLAYKQGTDAATPWTVVPVTAKQYTLTGLKAETVYSVRVCGICAVGDTSAYSEVVEFTTTVMTACPVPTDLRVEDTAENTAKLAWSGDELHESYLFRYRETTATAWDSVKDLKETAYALGSLKANTAYIWSVNGVCSEGRTSGWATASEFKTLGGVANEALLRAAFELYAAKGSVHLLNRRGIYVETVEIHAVDGRLLRREAVRSADHVFLPVAFGGMPVMVVLQTEAGRVTYKMLLP